MSAMLWPLFTLSQSTGAGTATSYSFAGHGWGQTGAVAEVQDTLRDAGVWANLWIRVTVNDWPASTFISRKNGAPGAQTVSIGASATGEFVDTTHSDTIASGDKINFALVPTTAGTQQIITAMRTTFAATTGSVVRYQASTGQNQAENGTTRFCALIGRSNADNATEANVQHLTKHAVTFQKFLVTVLTNGKGGTSTARFRKNAGNGNLNIPIGSGVTGTLEDTSNSDACVAGDLVNFSIDYFADANNLRMRIMAVDGLTTDRAGHLLLASNAAITVNASLTRYWGVGLNEGPLSAETGARTDFPLPARLSKANVYVSANTVTATSTLSIRKNGANATLLLSIGSSATGRIEDTTNIDVAAATDEFDWELITGASGTSLSFNAATALYTTPENPWYAYATQQAVLS